MRARGPDRAERVAVTIEVLREIFYNQTWIRLGYASPEDLWRDRYWDLSVRMSATEREQVAAALIASGRDDLPTSMLALAFDVSVSSMHRSMRNARQQLRPPVPPTPQENP